MISDAPASHSVVELVDQLEDVVSTARRLPLSASVVVNEDETLELVDRIRLGLPDELVQARHTLQDRERILTTAEEEADRMLSQAEQQAERLIREATERATSILAEHTLTEQARAHADTVVTEAEARAATVQHEADAYARDVMASLEDHLVRALATVRRGIETLPPGPSRPRMWSGSSGGDGRRRGRRRDS